MNRAWRGLDRISVASGQCQMPVQSDQAQRRGAGLDYGASRGHLRLSVPALRGPPRS